MNISTKVTAGLTVTSLAVLLGQGAWQVHVESGELEGAQEHSLRLVGRSLQVAVENALRDRQVQDITETLDKLEGVDPSVDIFVFDDHGSMNAASPGRRSGVDAPTPPPPGDETQYFIDSGREVPTAILSQRLRGDDGNPLGTMVVVRPLDDIQRDILRTQQTVLFNVFILVAVVAALQAALGRRYITKPLQRLAMAMEDVRPGSLPLDLPAQGNDEVAVLSRRFNEMLEQLRLAQRKLADEMEARERSQRHLQEVFRLATVGQLSSGLAHEIGSPLQVINGRARLLLEQSGDIELVQRNAQTLVEQTDRIARIVENLLRMARRPAAVKAPTDIAGAARAVVDFVEFEARRKGVDVLLRTQAGLPLVLADADQVQQVALNLVNNAIQASTRGSKVTVDVEGRPPDDANSSPAVRLRVTDEGAGIPKEVHSSLFEPFFTTRHQQGGTGLGLAVVKSIANDHGAQVGVEAAVPRGTTFTVDFPTLMGAPS